MSQIYQTQQDAQIEARKLNDARTRDTVEYVAIEKHDFSTGKMVVVGWQVGCCSND
jgi:hypothetical protein